jgi:hypothetical protein
LNHGSRSEQIWLTREQFEVLEIVARVLNQTISEYITETILSMLECDIEEIVPRKLEEKLDLETGRKINNGKE